MSVQVVTVMHGDHGLPSYYRPDLFLASLRRFGFEPIVLGLGQPWVGLMTKPMRVRDWLRSEAPKAERVIYCDAFDVLFAAHPDEVDAVCRAEFGDALVFNAERACWPFAEWAKHFPDDGSPWRYLNGGVMCGPTEHLRTVIESIDAQPDDHSRGFYPNDQVPYQRAFIDQIVPCRVDTRCVAFQCLSASSMDEFDLSGARPINLVTGTRPGIIHANGGAKNDLLVPFAHSMGLT